MTESNRARCHDCGVMEGELHELGCDMERCPFCGHQLISCDCCYFHLGLFNWIKYGKDTHYLPREIYENGLTPSQELRWERLLNEEGRIPWIQYPVMCAKCGKLWPDFFSVPDEEWKRYVQPDKQRTVICWECYDFIKRVIDRNAGVT